MPSFHNSHYEKFLATGEVKCIDEEIPFEIPDGWEWCRIASLFQINPKVVADNNISAAFIPMEAISAGYGSEFKYYEKKWGEIKSGYTAFADKDIAFAKITPCFQNRKSAIFDGLPNGIGAGTTELKVLRTYGENMNRWFVLYFLESPYFIDEATFKGTANQQRIIVGYLENKLFPVPPIAEQERIVNKIGLVMPVVDKYSKSQDYLNKINTELNDCLKKSILQEAIQGRLVSQDPSDEPASALLQRIREEKLRLVKEGKLKKKDITDSIIFKGDDNRHYEKIGGQIIDISEDIPFDIPDSWSWVRLRNICSIMTGATFKKEDARHDNQGIRVLRGGNILPFEIKSKDDDIFLSPDCIKQNILLKQNDLITPAVTSLENICKMARAEKDMPTTTVGGFVFILRPYYDLDSISIYLLEALSSPVLIEFVKSITNKSGQAFYNIGKERLGAALIPLPPIKEQERINDRIKLLWNNLR